MANILQTYLDKYGGQADTTKTTAGMGTQTGSVNQSGNVLANYFSKYGDGTSQVFTGISSPQQQWENMYQQYVNQYDMQQRAAQSLANTYRNTYEGMKRTNKEASRMTFEPGMEGYATDDMSALQMNTNPNYGKRVSDEDLAEKYRQWQEAEAKANEAKSVGDYWKSMYKFHNDADKVVADYDKRIAAMEADPNLKREASVSGSGNRDVEALKAERDAFIQTNTQYQNAADDYAALMAWNNGNKGTVANYKTAKEAYDNAEAELQALYDARKAGGGPEVAAFGAGDSTPDSERFANDEEIQAAIRKRDQAKMIMDYAYANRFEDIKNLEDYDLTADKGETAWQDFKENEQTQEMQYDEYGNPLGVNEFDPYYHTNFADQNENWTEDEKKTFYYLFATNRDNAFAYGNEVNAKYAKAEAEENSWGTREWAQRDFGTAAAASLMSIPAGLVGGLYDYMNMTAENQGAGGIYTTQYGGWSNWSEDVRGSIGTKLNQYGTLPEGIPVLGGKGLGDAYQLMMSMADSSVAALAGGGITNLMFFGNAAANATRNALERGASPDKALTLGLASGAAEVLGEWISVDKLLSNDLYDYLRTGILKSMVIQGGVEGSEEFFTTLLNTAADYVINGDKRELQQKIEQYTASGMSLEEAQKKAKSEWLEDLCFDAVGGFLSGAGMAGGRIGLNAASASMTPYQGDMQTLMDLTELTDEGSESRALAGRYKDAFDAYKAALETQGTDTGAQTAQEPTTGRQNKDARLETEADKRSQDEMQITQEQTEEAVQDEATQGQERVTQTEEKAAEKPTPKAEPRTGISALKGARLETALAKDLSAKDRTVLEEKATARLTDLGVENAGKAASAVVDRVLGSDKGAIGNAVRGLNFNDSRVRIVLQELTEQLAGQKTSASWLGNTELMTVGQNNAWTRTIENGLKQVRVKGSSERSKVTGATMVDGKLNLTVEMDGKSRTLSQDQLDLSDSQQRALGLLTRVLGDDAANAYDGMTIGNMGDVLQVMRYASEFGTVRDVLGRAGVKDDAALASPLRKGLTDAQVLRALAAGRKLGPVPEGQRAKSKRGTGAVSLEGGTLDGRKLGGVKNREAVTGSQRYKTIKKLAEALGIDVVLYESATTNDKGDLEDAPHGAYKDGVIWLDWNAGVYNVNKFNNKNGVRDYSSEAEALIFLTMSHEMTHFLEQNAEKEYNELRDFITQYMADNGKDFNGMVRRKLAEQSNIDHDEAVREVIADACQTMLVDSKYVEQLINEKPTLWERIRDWIRNFFGFAKTQAKGPEFEAIRDVAAQISELWDRALQVAVESRLSEETLQETPTIKDQAATGILTRERQQAILDEAMSRGVRTDRLADLYWQRDTVRNTPSQQTPLMLPAHEYTAKEKAAIKRRFNKAVEELMDSYLFDGIDLSREQAEQMVREYAAAHDGYFSLMDEAKQKGELKTQKQYAESMRAEMDSGAEIKTQFSMRSPVEQTDRLVAVHNKSVSGLRRMLQRGGVPFPSIAIKKAGSSHEGFGEVSIVFPRSTIDPAASRWNRLYSNDAWTPTEPVTEYEVSDKETAKIKKKIETLVGESVYSQLSGSSYLHFSQLEKDLRSSNGDIFEALKKRGVVKYAYLKSIGQDVALPVREKSLDGSHTFSNEQLIAVFDAIDVDRIRGGSWEDTELLQEIADVLNAQYEKQVLSEVKDGKEKVLAVLRNHPLFNADNVNLNWIKDALRTYEADGKKLISEPDHYELDRILRNNTEVEKDPAYKAWIEDMFGGIIKDSGIPNGKDMYTASGNLRSFKATHVPATLDNIVQQMRKENERGNGVIGTVLRGAATKSYGSVEEMRADSGRLLGTHVTDEVFDSYMDAFNNKLHELASSATKYPGRMGSYDTARETLVETVRDAKTKAQMKNLLRKEEQWINYSENLVDDLWALRNDVLNMPAPYFEAKPRRVVSPDEALAYIIPDNAGNDIVTDLESRGYNVMTYKAGDEQDRLAKLNSVEGAQFSSRTGDKSDRDYLAAVERGDMETAQRMVDRAAKDAGYTVHGYHGTGQRFTVFDKKKINSVWGINGGDLGFYFTPYKSDAEGYASYAAKGGNGYVVNAYLKMDNPLIVEDTGWGSAARQADIRNGDLKRWAEQGNNDGIIVRSTDEEMDDGFPDTVYVVFDSDQIKTADPVTYDDAGNVIPLSERFNSGNPDIRYSARTGDKSDRELLLDASDASLTDAEQKARAAYRAQVDGYRSRQQAVVTLIDAMDKAVRDGDATAATKLRAKLTEAEKKMAQALAGLTEAERGPELREILRREREIQRRRTDSRIRESYGRRELRQKVDRLWKDLTKRLSSPSEKKNIPVNVMLQAVDVLEAINMDATRADSKAGQKLRDRLNELKSRYNALKNDPDFRQAAMYDAQVAEFLDNMIETVGDTPINRMSAQQLAAVYNTLKALDHVARSALKVRLRTMEYSAYDISKRMTEETRSVGKQKAGAIDMFLNAGLSPARMFNRLGGYHKDSTWSQVYEMLNEGQLRQTQLQVEGSMLFEDLLAAKDYGKFVDPKNTVDVGLKDADGKTIEITHGMLVSLYMHLMNEQNRRHVAYGGLTIPGLTDYYNGKKIKGTENAKSASGVLQEIAEINDRIRETDDPALKEALEAERDAAAEKAMSYLEELQKAVEGKLTEYDRKWIAACRELFDGFSKRALNEATMQVYGIKRANVENYFPIWVDGNFLNTPFESVAKDFSLENAGFMKERVDSAKPIRLADVSDVAASQIRKVAQYAGLMPVIHDFNKIWGKTQTGYRDSVRQAVMQTYGQSGVNYIENLMADLNGARGMENSPLGEMLNRLRGHMAQASLTLSLRTAMGQVASYPTAAAVLGWDAIRQGITNYRKVDPELILKWSPLLKYRMQGFRDPELGQIAQMNSKFDRAWKKARWATGWIQAADGFTVGQLVWSASEAYVQIHDKSLKKGTDAYYEAVAKKFNEAVELTQPNYTTMQRPDILRNPNALVRQLTMFLTQRLQNFNIMYDAAATYSQMRKDRAAGKYGVTNEDVRQAGIRTRTAALSQITAAATIVAFKFLADMILHSMNAYRDDDDELTKESVSAELLDMFLDSLAGNVLGGGELYDLIESKAFGKTYYGIEVSGVSTVTDALKAVNDFYDKVAKGEVSWKEADKLAKKISVIAGIPYANAEKIIRGGIWHVQDMINGEFGSFEAGVDRTTGQQAHRLWRAYDAKDFAQAKKIRDEVGDDDKLNQTLAAYIKKQYADGKINKFEAQRQLEKYAGKDKETAEKTMREYSSEVETGIKFSQIEDSFLLGDITAQKAQQMLVKYGGLDAQTAKMKVDFWSYQNKNPGSKLEFSSYKTYVNKYQSIGLTVAQYESYSERLKDCRGVDADGDGKTDSGSKKAEVLKLIDSMILTPTQKDQLYYANNYGASGLKDTPWHK